jgi:hypothetical protein
VKYVGGQQPGSEEEWEEMAYLRDHGLLGMSTRSAAVFIPRQDALTCGDASRGGREIQQRHTQRNQFIAQPLFVAYIIGRGPRPSCFLAALLIADCAIRSITVDQPVCETPSFTISTLVWVVRAIASSITFKLSLLLHFNEARPDDFFVCSMSALLIQTSTYIK